MSGERDPGRSPRRPLETLRCTSCGRQADEWALVLTSQGIPSRVVRQGERLWLRVREEDVARARAALLAYEEENASAPEQTPSEPGYPGSWPTWVALLAAALLALFYVAEDPRASGSRLFEVGGADALRIAHGEVWRTVTALFLHIDLPHLAANMLFGAFFLAAVGRSLGPGLALALVLLAGASGNLVNALLRDTPHVTVGASTAVFGAVGLLSGLRVVGRRGEDAGWRSRLAPLAAGLALLAMLGSAGDRVDVYAHLFGLLVGTGLGAWVGGMLAGPPGVVGQLLAGGWALAVVVGSWWLALG